MPADPTYQTKNYEEQGGDRWVIGGTLEIAAGGKLLIDIGATQPQRTIGGNHAVSAGDVTATHAIITTGLTAIAAQNIQILRANKVTTSDATITVSGGNITIASGSTYTLTAADVIYWQATG